MFERHAGFSPDSIRAIEVFEGALENRNDVNEIPSLEEVSQGGNYFVVPFFLRTRHLPRGGSWLWNQSRNRITTQRVDGITGSLTFYKLGTRRTAGDQEGVLDTPPNYKIWIFNYLEPSDVHLSMVWCERGNPLSPFSSSDEEPALSDYSFLAPFTTEELAREFGWL